MTDYKHPTPAEFRSILVRLGLTQDAAAKLLVLDPRTIRRYVSGESIVQFPTLYTLIHRITGLPILPGSWRDSFDPDL